MKLAAIDQLPVDAKYDNDAHTVLFRYALPLMSGYQSDLAIDLETLKRAKSGDLFLWIVRDSGTHLDAIDSRDDLPSALYDWRKRIAFTKAYLLTVVRPVSRTAMFPTITIAEVR